MNDAELTSLLGEHNSRELKWAIGLAIASLFLWLFSYGLVAFFVLAITFVFRIDASAAFIHGVTAAVMVIMLIDAIRCQRELFDMERFAGSFYSLGANMITISVSANDPSVTRGNILQAAWGISEFLLCAPRCTIAAVRHYRSRTYIDAGGVPTAVKLFAKLAAARDWVDVAKFGSQAIALKYLDVVELLWTRVEHGVAQVKLAAEARSKYLGA